MSACIYTYFALTHNPYSPTHTHTNKEIVTRDPMSLQDTRPTVLDGATHADAQGERKQTRTGFARKCTHNNKKP